MGAARALEMKVPFMDDRWGADSCPGPSRETRQWKQRRGKKKCCLGFSSPCFPLHHWKKEEEKHSERKIKKTNIFFPSSHHLPCTLWMFSIKITCRKPAPSLQPGLGSLQRPGVSCLLLPPQPAGLLAMRCHRGTVIISNVALGLVSRSPDAWEGSATGGTCPPPA